MLKVEVAGYFVGKAKSLEEAEELVMGHIEWLDTGGKFDAALAVGSSVKVSFVIKQRGKVVFDGDAELKTVEAGVT